MPREKSDTIKLKTPKKLEEYKQSKPVQLNFFELLEPEYLPYSNTIELYDVMPKYYWGNQKRDENGRLPVMKREFTHKGEDCTITIQPASLEQKDNKFKDYYPAKREELVEDALRKLACDGNGIFLDEKVGITFTLYQLQQELKRMGHSYDLKQIKESIMTLAKSVMELKSADGKSIMISTYFDAVGLTTKDDWKSSGKKALAYVRFNPLVTDSIESKTYRLLNYNKSMSYKRVLARWLHKRLSHNFRQASLVDLYTIKLTTIIRDAGIKAYANIRQNMHEVEKALDEMVKNSVLARYETDKIKAGRKIVDVKFTFHPSVSFIKEVKYSNKKQYELVGRGKQIKGISNM